MSDPPVFIAERFRQGLIALLTAFDYASDSSVAPWQFAVALTDLMAEGATLVDIRWLILRDFAEHGKEITVPGDASRSFRRLPSTSLSADAYVVLTQQGADALRTMIPSHHLAASPESSAPLATRAPAEAPGAPVWDPVRR